MHAISVKDLRTQLPFVRSQLKKGEEFLIIYQSQPIARLSPVSDLTHLEEATEQDIERSAIEDMEDDYLTKEEVKYYMSLK
ncbi:MAG: hypothetical protein ABII13_03035 [Patescibacteria group bacterium]|nr:hypothetical protein [Patescibacteria group bacterium]